MILTLIFEICVLLTVTKSYKCLDDVDDLPSDDKLILTLVNPTKTLQGDTLFEGDIVDTTYDDGEDNELEGRKAVPSKGGLWPDGIIPYEFHKSVSPNTTKIIIQAMKEWEKKTCVTFPPRKSEKNYLRFRTDSEGCYTFVGRKYSNGQDVNLGEGCEHLSIAMHELGHSLGFFHEHSRRDRTSTIKILWHNIQKGLTPQFQTGNDNPRDIPYDVTSIMHYNPMSFSNQLFEKNTMISLDPHLQPLIGKNEGITFRDAKLANMLYSCDDGCPNKRTTQCLNDGYLEPYKGGSEPCSCVCPPNARGERCETVIGSYYGSPICGGDITQEGIIETPGYPKRYKDKSSCTWKIQAPSGKKVSVEFIDFSFHKRSDKPTSKYRGRCIHEHVEIRTANMDEGDMYCGEDIAPGTNIISSSNTLYILISAGKSGKGRGVKAKIDFV